MRYRGHTIVMVPWFDSEGMKQWTRLTFHGELDKKFLLKKVVQYIKSEFGKSVDKHWVRIHCIMMNQYDKRVELPEAAQTTFEQATEAWIKRLEEAADEDEDQPDSVLPSEDNGVAAAPLPLVPDSDRQ